MPISIYKISDANFKHTAVELTGYTWHIKQVVEILEEKQYASVMSTSHS